VTWEYEKIAPVKWPVRRHTLLWFLYELASPEFQQERWIGASHDRPGEIHGLSIVTDFVFDDTDLAKSTAETLGYILRDELEVTAVRHVGQAMEHLYDREGLNKEEVAYVNSPYWPKVVAAARKAYRFHAGAIQ
jgi:hypothetical protein